MRVAIHQPNFIPWMGLFDRLARVDRFVLFDHVQAVRGKSWFSRNKILVAGAPHWLTVAVERSGKGLQPVSEVRINPQARFPGRHLRTLEVEYGRHPGFAETMALVEPVFTAGHERLADVNAALIVALADALGLGVSFVRSTDLVAEHPELAALAGNDLVLATARAAGADRYLSGDGCHDFIDPEVFARHGVTFAFQEYEPPAYPQHGRDGPFVSHLSVLDALCNVGLPGLRALLTDDRPADGGR